MWLRKKGNFNTNNNGTPGTENSADEEKSNEGRSLSPQVSKQYLMSNQEIMQNDIIERIFKKFDSDGSGALDTGELIDLF